MATGILGPDLVPVTGLGLVLIKTQPFAGAASASVDNCFSATYENYRIEISLGQSVNAALNWRLRAAGVDAAGATYQWSGHDTNNTGTGGLISGGGTPTSWGLMIALGAVGTDQSYSLTIQQPQRTALTLFNGTGYVRYVAPGGVAFYIGGNYNATTSFDGFSIIPASGTITGTVRVYGLAN